MPKYFCDYCDTYLTHDSPSVRKSHLEGWRHKMAVKAYYSQFEQNAMQDLIEQKIRMHEMAAMGGGGGSHYPPHQGGQPPFYPPPPHMGGGGVYPPPPPPGGFMPPPPPGFGNGPMGGPHGMPPPPPGMGGPGYPHAPHPGHYNRDRGN